MHRTSLLSTLGLVCAVGCSGSPGSEGGGGSTGKNDDVQGSATFSGSLGDGPFVPKSALFVNFESGASSNTRIFLSTDADYCADVDHVLTERYPFPKNSQLLTVLMVNAVSAPATLTVQKEVFVQGAIASVACGVLSNVNFFDGTVDVTDVQSDTLTGSLDVTATGGFALKGTFTADLCEGLLSMGMHKPVCE